MVGISSGHGCSLAWVRAGVEVSASPRLAGIVAAAPSRQYHNEFGFDFVGIQRAGAEISELKSKLFVFLLRPTYPGFSFRFYQTVPEFYEDLDGRFVITLLDMM